MNEKDLIFENAEHDYPQRISYYHVSNDSLIAEISGNKGGELKSEQFPMRKKFLEKVSGKDTLLHKRKCF
jgi:hypothetical protein